MAETKRVLWADLVRIVAIYLVLVVHSSSLPQVNLKYLNIGFVTLAVAMTCVPLFVMVSGALLLPKKETYFN